jgi:hypothetical protein
MYLRKSRQDDPSETVEEVLAKHETILQEWAKRELGYEIPEDCIYREVVSGESIDDRAEIKKMLARIEDPNVAGIIVVEPQRLSRGDLLDCGTLINTLRYTKTLVATPMMTYDMENKMERRFFQDELMRGRDYLEYTKEILSRGKLASVKRGNFIGSVPPYGYNKTTIGKDHTLTPNEEEADVVRLIFDWFVNEGIGTMKITRRLNSMGIKPRNREFWYERSIFQILCNKHYDGKVVFFRRKTSVQVEDGKQVKRRMWQPEEELLVVEGKHPAIVDHEIFMKAQKTRYNEPRVKRETLMKNPLSGIVFCSKCGHNMIRHPYQHAEDRLACRFHKPMCMKSARLTDVIEATILALEESELPELKARLENGDGKAVAIQKRMLERLEKQMEEYRQQEEKQYDLLETGKYTQALFDKRNAALRQKMEDCQKQIFDTKQTMPKEVDYAERITSLETAIAALKDNTESCQKQNKLLKDIVSRIEMTTHEISPKKVGVNLKVFLRL